MTIKFNTHERKLIVSINAVRECKSYIETLAKLKAASADFNVTLQRHDSTTGLYILITSPSLQINDFSYIRCAHLITERHLRAWVNEYIEDVITFVNNQKLLREREGKKLH